MAANTWAVVLAGGDGQRLGAITLDASGLHTPKQYCSLNGGASLLQLALKRAARLAPRSRILVVATEHHRHWLERMQWFLPRSNLVIQPCNRGTGLGVLLPLLVIARSDPAARVVCLPSDHCVANEDILAESLRQATSLNASHDDELVLLGLTPEAPDPGFGYITPTADSGVGLRAVHSFVEKPDREAAARLISGGSAWNSGILVGKMPLMLDLYARHAPGLLQELTSAVTCWPDSRFPSAEVVASYSRHPALDFSRDVLQKQPDCLRLLPVPPCGWNDVGTPQRLATTLWALRPARGGRRMPRSRAGILNLATALARVQGSPPE